MLQGTHTSAGRVLSIGWENEWRWAQLGLPMSVWRSSGDLWSRGAARALSLSSCPSSGQWLSCLETLLSVWNRNTLAVYESVCCSQLHIRVHLNATGVTFNLLPSFWVVLIYLSFSYTIETVLEFTTSGLISSGSRWKRPSPQMLIVAKTQRNYHVSVIPWK